MSILIVASGEPRVGKSVIAAAIAWRMAREGQAVTLARLSGDADAVDDAATFATLEGVTSPGTPLDTASLAGAGSMSDIVVEAPAGDVASIAAQLSGKVLVVATPTSSVLDAGTGGASAGTIVTRAPLADVAVVASRQGVIAVLPEDRVLAAPSVDDIASAVSARWLLDAEPRGSIDRIMIGTIASDAGEPYFGARDRKAVVTRYDKTDVQLAALLTDMELLVLTGGGEPSPYLIDRVRGTREDISVVLAEDDTVGVMRDIEALYGASRFDGAGKMLRAAAMLDAANFPISFD